MASQSTSSSTPNVSSLRQRMIEDIRIRISMHDPKAASACRGAVRVHFPDRRLRNASVVVFKAAPFPAKILLAVPKQPLHIALATRILAKHKAVRPNVLTAKDTIKWLCENRDDLSKENQRLLEALERGTGLSIADLAVLTDDWPD
jgi:hypothetical protein